MIIYLNQRLSSEQVFFQVQHKQIKFCPGDPAVEVAQKSGFFYNRIIVSLVKSHQAFSARVAPMGAPHRVKPCEHVGGNRR